MGSNFSKNLDRTAIIDKALGQLPQLLDHLGLQVASKTSDGLCVGSDSGSLRITTSGINAGLWHDFGGSYSVFGKDVAGGDLVHLFAAFKGNYETYGHGLRALDTFLGGGSSEDSISMPVVRKPRMSSRSGNPDNKRTEIMQGIVANAASISGSTGEIYLRSRGIDLEDKVVRKALFPALKDLRFNSRARLYYSGTAPQAYHEGPALLLIGRDEDGAPTNIQQIFLTPDGSGKLALSDKNGKPVAVKRSLCPFQNPFRLPAPDGPENELILTEGPENALSLRAALDVPVWACFGNSNLSKLDIPDSVSHITIASDGDHPNAPAEKVFHDLAYRYRCLGYHVRLVSLRDGDVKADANDFLQQHGRQALADRISATPFEPPYPMMSIEEGQAALEGVMDNILTDLRPRIQSLVQARTDAKAMPVQDPAALKSALIDAGATMQTYLLTHEDEVTDEHLLQACQLAEEICAVIKGIKTGTDFRADILSKQIAQCLGDIGHAIADVAKSDKLDGEEIAAIIQRAVDPFAARFKELLPSSSALKARSRRAHRARMEQLGMAEDPPVSLVLGTPGLGKTHSLQRIIQELDTNAIIWVLQPTLSKADEFEQETRDMIDLPITVVRGRSAVRPCGQMMCARGDFAERLGARGRQIGQSICRRVKDGAEILCPYYEGCLYIGQQEALKAHEGGGVFVMSHTALTMPSTAPKPDLVIVDEDPSFSLLRDAEIDASRFDPNADWRQCVEAVAAPKTSKKDKETEAEFIEPAITKEDVQILFETVDAVKKAFNSPRPLHLLTSETTSLALKNSARTLRLVEEQQISPIRPDMPDRQIKDIIAELDELEIKKIGRILRSARAELNAITHWTREGHALEDCRPYFNGITLDQNAIVKVNGHAERLTRIGAYFLAENKVAKATPIIVLDGTADPELLACALRRDAEKHRIDVERMGEVIQVYGKSFSTRSLVLDDSPSSGNRRAEEVARLQEELISFVEAEEARTTIGVFVCSALRVKNEIMNEERGKAWQDKKIDWAHFGATRGINKWQECSTAILVGRKQPPPRAILNMARAFYALDPEPLDDPEDPATKIQYVRAERELFDKQGNKQTVEIEKASDRRMMRVLWQMREAESIQALDRVRAARNFRRIILLGDMDLRRPDDPEEGPGWGLPADAFFRWLEISAGETRMEKILNSCDGFFPLAPRPLYQLAKGEFGTVAAAKKWLQRSGLISNTPNHYKSLWVMPSLVRLRVRAVGTPGRGYALLLDTSRHPCLKAAQARFEDITGAKMAEWKEEAVTGSPSKALIVPPALPEEAPRAEAEKTAQILGREIFQQKRQIVMARRAAQAAAPQPVAKTARASGLAPKPQVCPEPEITPMCEEAVLQEAAQQLEKRQEAQRRRDIETLQEAFRDYAQSNETDPDMWA